MRCGGDGHFVGLPKVLARVCKLAKLKGVTPPIAGLLGHTAGSATSGYVHLDLALVYGRPTMLQSRLVLPASAVCEFVREDKTVQFGNLRSQLAREMDDARRPRVLGAPDDSVGT